MSGELIDDFLDISHWRAIASDQAQLTLAHDAGPDTSALRFDFDFKGGGFIVARREIMRVMPSIWAIEFHLRGVAIANRLEIKLVDPTNRNVWWWRRDPFVPPGEWQTLRVCSHEFEFAWGPAGGGMPHELGAIEIAIIGGQGDAGSVWISDLRLEDLTLREPPRVSASSCVTGHHPEQVLDSAADTAWRSSNGTPQWLTLDFGREHEYGGLVIDWEADAEARAFDVQTSSDGVDWTTRWTAHQAEGPRSYVYLEGCSRSRYLRLALHAAVHTGRAFGIRAIDVRPIEFSRSLAEFFHAIAANERRGRYPRWLYREQSYWTAVGIDAGASTALLNEEGMFEPDRGSFSLEPFLYVDGELITWADVAITQSLAGGYLPIPTATWRHGELILSVTAFVSAGADGPAACARYRLENTGRAPRSVRLAVAIRPFQVTPPWQAFREMGGTSTIRELAWRDHAVLVNGVKHIVPLNPPSAFGAAAFEQGGVLRWLERGESPPRTEIRDAFGQASGALIWDMQLAPGGAGAVEVAVPYGTMADSATTFPALRAGNTLALVTQYWEQQLGQVRIEAPEAATGCLNALRTAVAHILICRHGAALQPGPRRYSRSWIRDGSVMSAALLRLGCNDVVRDYLRWYALHQAADGNVPCAVDQNIPDWLPEHDSHGQFAYSVAEHFRLTGDREFARELWPHVSRAIDYLAALRERRMTPEFLRPERQAFHGLLPESASHEGYIAHPVHAYWDDFWALRGIGDALFLARVLGHAEQAARIATLYDGLRQSVYASIDAIIAARALTYVPGSVELADFDPTATATAIAISDAADRLRPAALHWTFEEYLRGLRERRSGAHDWERYSAYEVRIMAALVRLGRRAEAHELLDFLLADRRPRAWNQWPEVSWRDTRRAVYIGDVPHAWIGAEYVLAVLTLFAYERPADDALVLAAGLPESWLENEGVTINGLPTWWGPLGYSLCRAGPGELRFELTAGLDPPPGGILVQPPLPRPLRHAELDGTVLNEFTATGVTLRQSPASLVLRF